MQHGRVVADKAAADAELVDARARIASFMRREQQLHEELSGTQQMKARHRSQPAGTSTLLRLQH
jgi:hypothetical protein